MSTLVISGQVLRDAIISGANAIENDRHEIDKLNIFPVPDGDTGINMSMTMSSARAELYKMPGESTASEVADKAASMMLRGARGNSGVILSLLFRGFSKGLKNVSEASGKNLAEALTLGVDAAYKAVMKPTEGTILTVARVAAEKARAAAAVNDEAKYIWGIICTAAEEALQTTPDLLPVLKRAGVVDAGGQGLCCIFRGMQAVINGGDIIKTAKSAEGADQDDDAFKSIVAEFDEVINFTYCTEFIVEKANDSDPAELRAYLETIGDCVVVVDDDEIIKVHVHTDTPGNAITCALTFGPLITTKIENMREQHKNAGKGAPAPAAAMTRVDPVEGELGFVAVAAGEGLCALFNDLGCQNVVTGGQTMNPSTDDILKAVQATPASTVFVLPNNKNIIMAAEQCVPLADRNVVVLPTRTIPQGIAAMLAYDPDADNEINSIDMFRAAEKVATGQITYAARDSEFDSKRIKEGDVLALNNGKLVFLDKNPVKAVVKLTRQMATKDTSFVTLIYGEGISDEQAEEARKGLESKLGKDVEIMLVNGGQPVYYFIVSIE
ncbi:MAG: DAK2 domain-containing protein [Ruminococcaceae bacterium]|nr:DAK2 domain-containing protein [Oscillospiraceae bacterium]